MQKSIVDRFAALSKCPHTWARIAGVSGALAIGMGAYAAHSSLSEENKDLVLRANKYHLISSVALLALSANNSHPISGCLITVGTLLFCGSLYAKGLFGTPAMYLPPLGGIIMIIGWLSIVIRK